MRPTPPALPEPPGDSDERSLLEGFLDMYRAVVVRKVEGLSDDLAGRAVVESGTSVAGLVRHLRWVEHAWFVEALAGEPRPAWRADDPQWQFRVGDEGLAVLVDEYLAAVDESRTITAGLELDAVGHNPHLGDVSLRWIYGHMVQETARHAGHLDILVEQLTGGVGFNA
ncbi:DinB family protein [Aestuariimicrobium soli]|uniref:DinB family protein n=1 Tax=Aestuariimicrobium soli TaxID=2035834 RepID=UPI003EB7A019